MEMQNETVFEDLQSDLETIEAERVGHLQRLEWRKTIALPLGVALTAVCGPIDWFLLMVTFKDADDDGFVGLTVIALGFLWRWVTNPRRDYIKAYKEKIMPRIARAVGNLTYEAKGCIPMEAMLPSKIVPSYEKVTSEDCFVGEYKGVDIKFCELKLTETHGSGKNRRTVTKFKGLVILLEMERRKFLGHTILVKNQSALGGWFTQKTKGLMRADLVDPAFEKLFDVYTSDQVEARYLIDPHLMQKLTDMNKHYKGESLSAAYYDSQMLIMISSNHNFFEPPDIYVPAVDKQAIKMLQAEIAQIVSIIDYLEMSMPDVRAASA